MRFHGFAIPSFWRFRRFKKLKKLKKLKWLKRKFRDSRSGSRLDQFQPSSPLEHPPQSSLHPWFSSTLKGASSLS